MNLFWMFTITLLCSLPLIYCKPKKSSYGAQYPNTLRQRNRRRRSKELEKKNAPPTSPQASKTPTASTTPTTTPPNDRKKVEEEMSVEPTQNGEEQSHPIASAKKVVRSVKKPSKELAKKSKESTKKSREPTTAKEKSTMKTARKVPPRDESFMESQNEDETMVGVKSIEN